VSLLQTIIVNFNSASFDFIKVLAGTLVALLIVVRQLIGRDYMNDIYLINTTVDALDFQNDGERMILVLLKDKESQEIIGSKLIKRALLAKYMQPITDHNVSAQNGRFVLEI
jgi:hypothetical protein